VTEDLWRCTFIAHLNEEPGIKQRIEFSSATFGEMRRSVKWYFDDWNIVSTFRVDIDG
jgi:hypothetical protein